MQGERKIIHLQQPNNDNKQTSEMVHVITLQVGKTVYPGLCCTPLGQQPSIPLDLSILDSVVCKLLSD